MKLKIRFPEWLLPFWKQKHTIYQTDPPTREKPERKSVNSLLILWLFVLLIGALRCTAQSSALKVGDKVPNIKFTNVLNYKSQSLQLSDFKDKVVVLDFWATWCGACIEEMPELSQLKRTIGDRLEIISVTTQPALVITNFLKKNDLARNQHLIIATDDVTLSKLFPHVLVPHFVWISPGGTYLGATTQQDLNANTINQIFNFGHADFKDFKNDNLTFDPNKPLFQNGNGGSPPLRYRCILTGYEPGLPSTLGIRNDSLGTIIRATNVGLNSLILRALGVSSTLFGRNRFYVDKQLDTLINSTERSTLFCFELYEQGFDRESAQKEMLSYLESYFHFKAVLQRRLIRCLILKSIGDHARLAYNGKDSTDNLSDRTSSKKVIRGEDITSFSAFLDHSAGFMPVINETGLTSRVSMDFDEVEADNIDVLNRQLLKYGLQLKEEQRPLNIIAVSKWPSIQPNY